MNATARSALLTPFKALSAWLDNRAPRERRLLKALAGFVPLAAAVAVLGWALDEQQRLDRRLPQARAELERMQQDATELARLKSTAPPPALTPTALAGAALAAASARGLQLDIEPGPDGLLARGSAPLPALIDWLAAIHAEQGLRPTRLEYAEAGAVEAVLVARDAQP